MKKGTLIKIKSNGHRAILKKAVYKNSRHAYVWDYDSHIDCNVPVDQIETQKGEQK